MTTPQRLPILQNIFHPSDFSAASETAFAHALKIALIAKATLTIFHVSPDRTGDWTDFPGVRETLERWGTLPHNSPKSAVPKLGIQVKKVIAHETNPVKSVLTFLESHLTDLIVLATQQDKGKVLWLEQSIAQPIARKSQQMTLFIPAGVKGFVSFEDGSVALNSILIPVAPVPNAQPALDAAVRIAEGLSCPTGQFTVLSVGDNTDMPDFSCRELPGWEWTKRSEQGDATTVILQIAHEMQADLIIMPTEGRQGFLDALRGSTSEQMLRQCTCPLLAIPTNSWISSVL
jgi:nucleotide-binding universal stress UspA family protein